MTPSERDAEEAWVIAEQRAGRKTPEWSRRAEALMASYQQEFRERLGPTARAVYDASTAQSDRIMAKYVELATAGADIVAAIPSELERLQDAYELLNVALAGSSRLEAPPLKARSSKRGYRDLRAARARELAAQGLSHPVIAIRLTRERDEQLLAEGKPAKPVAIAVRTIERYLSKEKTPTD